MTIQRAKLSETLEDLRPTAIRLIPILESEPAWYGSVYIEKKTSQNFSANLKQTQMADQISFGAVLRIYDGFTLYEEATDEVDTEALNATATRFAARVKGAQRPASTKPHPYSAPAWKDRLSSKLDREITSQISGTPDSKTPVHFGIRFERDPFAGTPADNFAFLSSIVERIKTTAKDEGLSAADLSYVMARLGVAREESIFVDREANISQTLYRVALTLVTMSGADRTFLRMGGLGGMETVDFEDAELRSVLKNLKSLKGAERLNPGKYRVIFGPVLTGVLAHEAFGHSQEGDTCARGRSKAWEIFKTGQPVGNEQATILNNPAVYENGGKPCAAWGSYFFDEEGWLASEQVLLDRGILKAPMTNLTSAIRLGVPRTANGKRESWANGVYTRQTNTYFSAGDKTLDELFKSLGDGFIALNPAGGMEDPKGMGIQVGISFLEEVRGGKPTGKLFKGPAGGDIQMTGYTPDVLNSIVAKSKIDAQAKGADKAKHPFNDAGGCGKYHKEVVYAGCGGPYMLLNEVTLG